MTRFTFVTFAAAAAAAYLGIVDRQSPLALTIVELETRIGMPIWMLLAGTAAAGMVLKKRRRPRHSVPNAPAPSQPARSQPYTAAPTRPPISSASPAAAPTGSAGEWLQPILDSAKNILLPAGARITHNVEGTTPFELHLEHAPPERCRRAVTAVAQWLSAVPLPPRMRIHFKNCPKGGSPRHHQVAGAIASVMPRGSFKVTSGLDSVDVQFLHFDPLWTSHPQSS